MVTLKISIFLVLATAAASQQLPTPTALSARSHLPARGPPRAASPALPGRSHLTVRGPPRTASPALQSSEEFGRSFYSDEDDDAKYDFSWGVSDEDTHIGFHEDRNGDNTRGSYSVLLPDGRRQTVTYYVDGDSGFVAKVSYEGEAFFSDESDEFVRRS